MQRDKQQMADATLGEGDAPMQRMNVSLTARDLTSVGAFILISLTSVLIEFTSLLFRTMDGIMTEAKDAAKDTDIIFPVPLLPSSLLYSILKMYSS